MTLYLADVVERRLRRRVGVGEGAQRGVRPCVAVSDPVVNADQRFPLIAVVPITGTPGGGALYPELSPGTSGLSKTSFALIDQLRSIDKRRTLPTGWRP